MTIAQIRRLGFSVEAMGDFSSLSDEELLEASLRTPSAFEAILNRYQTQFLSRAQSILGNRDLAEDVVQEAFVRIYRFAPRFKAEAGNFRAWSLTILMNVARTHYRKSARERHFSVALNPEHYESLADHSIETKEGDSAYARDVVTKAIQSAPRDVARILKLAFIEDLPYKDIARQEGLSIAAVKTRVHRAKAVLKNIINNSPS